MLKVINQILNYLKQITNTKSKKFLQATKQFQSYKVLTNNNKSKINR